MYVYCTNSWVIGKNWSIRHSYIVSAVANIATKDLADINIDLCLRKLSGFNPNGSAEVG